MIEIDGYLFRVSILNSAQVSISTLSWTHTHTPPDSLSRYVFFSLQGKIRRAIQTVKVHVVGLGQSEKYKVVKWAEERYRIYRV